MQYALTVWRMFRIPVILMLTEQQIEKFPRDTVLRLSRSAKTVFLQGPDSCKNTIFALLRKLSDLLTVKDFGGPGCLAVPDT
jgi:hypothetical protein